MLVKRPGVGSPVAPCNPWLYQRLSIKYKTLGAGNLRISGHVYGYEGDPSGHRVRVDLAHLAEM